ncbi:hypothetical protein LguiA_020937 [Lonicera macranthoides]
MDTLVQGYSNYTNELKYNHHTVPPSMNRSHLLNHTYTNLPNDSIRSLNPAVDESPPSDLSSEKSISEENDYFDEVLKYMNQMLMEEEDLENKPCMFHECSALQAAEKSFYDVIGEKYPFSPNLSSDCTSSNDSNFVNNLFDEPLQVLDEPESEFNAFLGQSSVFDNTLESNLQPFVLSNTFYDVGGQVLDTPPISENMLNQNYQYYTVEPKEEISNYGSRQKKNHYREDSDSLQEERSNKHLAGYAEESVESLMYDKVLLCPNMNPGLLEMPSEEESLKEKVKIQTKGSNNAGRPKGKKQGISKKEVVDLRSLLTQCAQAVASSNVRAAGELLKKIKQHSSPYGDGTERLGYYFANALEARLAGTGMSLYAAFANKKIMAAEILKAYQSYVTACPFHKMSNIFANKSIGKLANGASRLHIIDFGILYGFQWPSLIQCLSMREGGPPRLKITGIDWPQPGFRPAERVEDSGRRLANYCQRFNVPFKFNAIAKKWENITIEDLKIDREEMIVVNSLYRLRNVPDETVVASSPRDTVLNLVKRINPDMFILGVLNGTFNAPFFVTRFREALFHFSTLFDMFEATAQREDRDRMLFEQEVFARDAMNVIACEGTGRIERPETYKQWQVRNHRAGFRQMGLYNEIVKEVSGKVRSRYHKDFLVDEDSNWMLQGWKGRVLYALSCWKPVQD